MGDDGHREEACKGLIAGRIIKLAHGLECIDTDAIRYRTQ